MTESQLLTETARFNMIEQQIRTASVLDPVVLKLLAVVRREDFVPIAFRDLAFADVNRHPLQDEDDAVVDDFDVVDRQHGRPRRGMRAAIAAARSFHVFRTSRLPPRGA